MIERFLKSIEFIETNLFDALTLADISANSNYSNYHFSRMFKALVGDSPMEYVRKRRISEAVKLLSQYKTRMIELAVLCGFESQEAFTRAFKKQIGVSPMQYIKDAPKIDLKICNRLSAEQISHIQEKIDMQPTIVEKQACNVIGVTKTHTLKGTDLASLWASFKPYAGSIKNRQGSHAYGIYEGIEQNQDDLIFQYTCAVQVAEVDDIPDGMNFRTIDAHTYAVFKHKGPINTLNQSIYYIWGSWLPKSKYQFSDALDFEIYPSKYNPHDSENDVLEICVPIVPS